MSLSSRLRVTVIPCYQTVFLPLSCTLSLIRRTKLNARGKGSCYEHKTANIQEPSFPFSVPGMDSSREDVLQMVLKALILTLPKTRYEEALLIRRRSIYAFDSEPEVVELLLIFEAH